MEILKGMVREKGFADKECTYMKTDDGKQYYFIEDFQLSNGNIIACSDLSQGVGNKPRQTLGVITPKGEIVIPFENKTIKPLENNLLLVERNVPITQNVVEKLERKDDSTFASEMMNDANNIKSQLKSVMAGSENFLFDNPFSEAALYTLEGVNVGGNYFSFIGQSGNDYYLSTNVVGSSILKYDSSINIENSNMGSEQAANNPELNIEQNAVQQEEASSHNIESSLPENVPINNNEGELNQEPLVPNIEIPLQLQQQADTADVESAPLNQENVEVPDASNKEQEITNATNETIPSNEENPPVQDTSLNLNLPADEMGLMNNSNEEVSTQNELEQQTKEQTIDNTEIVEGNDLPIPNANSQELNQSGELNLDFNQSSEEEVTQPENEEIQGLNISNLEEDLPENDDESSEEEESDSTEEVAEDSSSDNDFDDDSSDGGITSDAVSEEDFSDDNSEGTSDDYEEEPYANNMPDYYPEDEITNPVIIDATNTIRKLLDENRRQREIIDRQDSEIETLTSSNGILKENNDSKSKEIISLRNGLAKYRSQNSSLSRENNNLKATNTRQEELIENLKNQNITLKEQVAGIRALGNAVKEATTVIDTHRGEDFDQSSDFSYLDGDMGEMSYQKVKYN